MEVRHEQLVHFPQQHAHLSHADGGRATAVEQYLLVARHNERADAEALRIWRRTAAASEENHAQSPLAGLEGCWRGLSCDDRLSESKRDEGYEKNRSHSGLLGGELG